MYDLIIIGAGPAGLTAGLYAGRFRLKTLILEKMNIGGQIILSSTIENFPGFPKGITTQELIDKFKQQVEEVGINIEPEEVIAITPDVSDNMASYQIRTSEKKYSTRSIIVASGAEAKRLEVAGEAEFIGRGVSYCGTCDGPLFKNKEIIVVGAGDRAIEEAIFLTGYAKKVTVIHRRKELRASKILEEKVKSNPKINFILDSIVEEIIGSQKVERIILKNVLTLQLSEIPCDGVFIFVGIKPNTEFLKNLLRLNDTGFIITDKNLKTSLEGVFACGDCLEKSFYQVVNACGEAAVAADSAHKYLLMLKR